MSSERWVACPSCRDAGKATGEWFEQPDEITPDDVCLTGGHQTVTILGHGNLTRILHHGEGSPAEKVLAAAALADLDLDRAEPDAYVQWTAHTGREFGPASAAAFVDAYRGTFPDRATYTRHYCEQIGEIDVDAPWPHNCIDWHRAAHDLFCGPRYDLAAGNGWLHIFAADR